MPMMSTVAAGYSARNFAAVHSLCAMASRLSREAMRRREGRGNLLSELMLFGIHGMKKVAFFAGAG